MGYTLNIDHWDWVNPETQKVTRLRRGDEVPGDVLSQDGIDEDELTKGPRPVLLKGTGDDERRQAGPQMESAATSAQARSQSPKVAADEKK